MKQSEVEVGGYYHARVGELVTIVKVGPPRSYSRGNLKAWSATNVRTGRVITVTAARLRDRVERRGYEYSTVFGHCLVNEKGDYTSVYFYDYGRGKWAGVGGQKFVAQQEAQALTDVLAAKVQA